MSKVHAAILSFTEMIANEEFNSAADVKSMETDGVEYGPIEGTPVHNLRNTVYETDDPLCLVSEHIVWDSQEDYPQQATIVRITYEVIETVTLYHNPHGDAEE